MWLIVLGVLLVVAAVFGIINFIVGLNIDGFINKYSVIGIILGVSVFVGCLLLRKPLTDSTPITVPVTAEQVLEEKYEITSEVYINYKTSGQVDPFIKSKVESFNKRLLRYEELNNSKIYSCLIQDNIDFEEAKINIEEEKDKK